MSIDQQCCVNCGWIGTRAEKERREDSLYSSTYVCPICKDEQFYLLDDLENKVDEYSHYAIITPPQTNQS